MWLYSFRVLIPVLILLFNALSSISLSGIIKELYNADNNIHFKNFFEFYNDNTFLQPFILYIVDSLEKQTDG
jgi:mannose/fructose/N-acetylgalactosamine-specific phosphotransferase system component IID